MPGHALAGFALLRGSDVPLKPALAIAGVLVATMSSEFNDQVSQIALADILGGFHIGHDPGTWIETLYSAAEIVGMAISPFFLVALSLRLWTLGVIVAGCVFSVLIPLSPNVETIYTLRVLQGLSGGLMIPILLTTALKLLPPPKRLYGLAVYALTATFTPGFSTVLAALWTDVVHDWRFVFLQPIPLGALGFALVWFAVPQDAPQPKNFAKFDVPGLVLLLVGAGALTTMLLQGDRLDWFDSPVICVAALLSAVAVPLLLLNEWFQSIPFLKLQLLGRRNFAYAVVGIFLFLIVSQSGTTLPLDYLRGVQGYRPLQAFAVTLVIAASQFAMLPLLLVLLDQAWADARVVSLAGLALIIAACVGCSTLDETWNAWQFFLWQGLQAAGQPLVVVPLLLLGTNEITKPEEGPFASAMVNTSRAVAEVVGVWVLDIVDRWRGALHASRLSDQAGLVRWRLIQGEGVLPRHPPPLLADGQPRVPGSLAAFKDAVGRQVEILTTIDGFLVLGGVAVLLMAVVVLLPKRTPPPRVKFAKS